MCVCVCVTVHRSNRRRLHDDVIDNSPGDQEVGEEDEREDDHGGGDLHEARLLQFDVGHLQHREGDAVKHLQSRQHGSLFF